MRIFFARVLVFFLGIALAGCSSQLLGRDWHGLVPDSDTPRREHPLGMAVYNKTGRVFSDEEWERRLKAISEARVSFDECLAAYGKPNIPDVYATPIVIIAGGKIYRKTDKSIREMYAFYILTIGYPAGPFMLYSHYPWVFLRDDMFRQGLLRHEWVHVYLGLAAGDSDTKHASALFNACEYGHGSYW